MEACDDIDGLMEMREVKAFLDKHQHDPKLRNLVKRALEHLTVTPFDPETTKRWKGVRFYLESDRRETPRNLRRFSFQHFPEADGSPIASRSRLVYAIVKQNGEPAIAMYGIFLKQDIERVNALPKRR